METVLGIILLLAAVFLVVAVLMQSGKSHNLSGTIAGGADTFFGKTKGKTIDKMLSKVTSIVAVCFVILVIVMYVIQPSTKDYYENWLDQYLNEQDSDSSDTSANEEESGASDESAQAAVESGNINEGGEDTSAAE